MPYSMIPDRGKPRGAGVQSQAVMDMLAQYAQGLPSPGMPTMGAMGMITPPSGNYMTPEQAIANLPAHLRTKPEYQGSANAREHRLDLYGKGDGRTLTNPQTYAEEKAAEQTTEQGDPNADLLAQLTALAMQSGSGLDVDAMIADATGGINKTYGSQIGGIRHEMGGARADTRKGKKQILKMYRALGRSEERAAGREARASEKYAGRMADVGTASAAATQENANQLLNQNAAAAAGLGAPGIAAELNADVTKQAADLGDRAIGYAGRQAGREKALSGVNQRFFRESAGSARLEGTNRAADLLSQLQDYLGQARGQIGELRGEKASALAAAKNSILAQASQASTDTQQQNFENMMAIAGLQSNLQNTAADNQLDKDKLMAQLQQQAGGGQEGPDFSDLFSSGYGKNLQLAGQVSPGVSGAYNQFRGSPEAGLGYFENGKNNLPLNNENSIYQYVNANFPNLPEQDRDALVGMILNQGLKPQMPQY